MSETEKCPPWKRIKLTQPSLDETKTISNRVPKFEKWISFRQHPAIAELNKDEVFRRTVTGIMNKLTWANFDKLSEEIFNLQIDTSQKIQLVADMIHKRAIVESNHRILYVKMCGVLTYAQIVNKRDSILSFRECLASKCEEFFTQSLLEDSSFNDRKRGIDSCHTNLRKTLLEACKLEESMCRKKSLGNCEFVGELFKLNMISSEKIIDMLDRLSSATLCMAVGCICKMITTVGQFYEEKIGKLPEKYFSDGEYVLKSDNVPVWIRFLIQEMLDLRNNNWDPKKRIERVQDDAQNQQTEPVTIPQEECVQQSEYNQCSVGLQQIEPVSLPSQLPIQEYNQYPVELQQVEPVNIPSQLPIQEYNPYPVGLQQVEPVPIPLHQPMQEYDQYSAGLQRVDPVPIPLHQPIQEYNQYPGGPHRVEPVIMPMQQPIQDYNQYPVRPHRVEPLTMRMQQPIQDYNQYPVRPHRVQPITMRMQQPIQDYNQYPVRPHRVEPVTMPMQQPGQELIIYQKPVQLPPIMPAPISLHERIQEAEMMQIRPQFVQPANIPQMEPIRELEVNQIPPQIVEPATAPLEEPVQEEMNQDPILSEAQLESRLCEALEIELVLPLVDVQQFELVTDAVLRKVISESDNCRLYAELCKHLWNCIVSNGEDKSINVEFKNVVLHKCHQLLDKLKTEILPNEEKEQSDSFEDTNSESYQKVVCIELFLIELHKLEMLTPETIYRFSSKLIEFKSEEVFTWLRNLLPLNAKPILSKLKNQNRIVEMFQFFDKLESANRDIKYTHRRRFPPKTALRRFIYGPDAESVIEEIVINNPIPPLKEFSPSTLHLYLRTFLRKLRVDEIEPPHWIVSKMSMFRSNKNVPEAIRDLLSIEMLKSGPVAEKSGQLIVDLIKWNVISAQDVIEGFSSFLTKGIYEKTRKHLQTFSRYLFESGLFTGDNLTMLSPEHLDLVPANENRWKYVDSVDDPSVVENFPSETLKVKQRQPNSRSIKNLIHNILTNLNPYDFNPAEFRSQLNDILTRVEHLKMAASFLIKLVNQNPNLYVFYIKICCPILKLTVNGKEFWEVLLLSCDSYFDQFCVSDTAFVEEKRLSKNMKRKATKKKITESSSEANTQPCSNDLNGSLFITVEVPQSSKPKSRCGIDVPGRGFSVINDFKHPMKSACPLCGTLNKTLMNQLDIVKKKVTYCKELIQQLQKKVSFRQVGKKAVTGKNLKKLSGGRCTVYVSEEIFNALKTKTHFNLKMLCYTCYGRNTPLTAQYRAIQEKMNLIDELMAYIYAQVDFKVNEHPVLPEVKKKVQDKRIELCRFTSMLINVLNNETADFAVKRIMRKLLDALQIELFSEIYLHLEWKEARFETSLFKLKIPAILSNNESLKIEHRRMLEGVTKDFANEGAHRIITKIEWSENNCEMSQKSDTNSQSSGDELSEEDSNEKNTEKSIENPCSNDD